MKSNFFARLNVRRKGKNTELVIYKMKIKNASEE